MSVSSTHEHYNTDANNNTHDDIVVAMPLHDPETHDQTDKFGHTLKNLDLNLNDIHDDVQSFKLNKHVNPINSEEGHSLASQAPSKSKKKTNSKKKAKKSKSKKHNNQNHEFDNNDSQTSTTIKNESNSPSKFNL